MYPHKNYDRLLQAYYTLKSNRFNPWPLVLRGDPKGAETSVMEMIARLKLERDVILLPKLDTTELPAVYSGATALVFPSLYEGGGIPVVEAMACGCPVIASDLPPLREFASDAASYFDPSDILSITKAMAAFQNNAKDRELKRNMRLARAQEFKPEPIIARLLNAYDRAAHGLLR